MADGTADIEALEARVVAAKAALTKAEADYAAEQKRVDEINAEIEASGEEPFTSGPDIGPLQAAVGDARSALWSAEDELKRAQAAAAAVAAEHAAIDAANADDTLDTGHYDDGHGFGWKQAQDTGNWNKLTESADLSAETRKIEEDLGREHDERMEAPLLPPPAPTSGLNKKVVVGGILAVALIAVVAVVALVGGGGGSSKTETVANTDASTANDAAATSVAGAGSPVRYQSNCQGACFMVVDAATCDRTFHFDLVLLGDDVAKFEGKTAVISTLGPGLQPTYEVPVSGGKVVLDAVATGASYGGDPSRSCGVNGATLQWTGLLTSVDGHPTITPDPPQAAN
jgi:hypothetical protein